MARCWSVDVPINGGKGDDGHCDQVRPRWQSSHQSSQVLDADAK